MKVGIFFDISEVSLEKTLKPKLKRTATYCLCRQRDTLGIAKVDVQLFDGIQHTLPLYVTDIPLFGLDCCFKWDLQLPPGSKICKINTNTSEITTSVSF